MPKFTIQDLAEGRCAVKNDGTLEELNEVLKKAFPNDASNPQGNILFYGQIHPLKHCWDCSNDTNLPYQSVKDFLTPDQEKTERALDEFQAMSATLIKGSKPLEYILSELRQKAEEIGLSVEVAFKPLER